MSLGKCSSTFVQSDDIGGPACALIGLASFLGARLQVKLVGWELIGGKSMADAEETSSVGVGFDFFLSGPSR
jgi:hypothetical protein